MGMWKCLILFLWNFVKHLNIENISENYVLAEGPIEVNGWEEK